MCYWRPTPFPWMERKLAVVPGGQPTWELCLVQLLLAGGSCGGKGSGFDCVPWEPSSHRIEQGATAWAGNTLLRVCPFLAGGLACLSSVSWSESRRVCVLLEEQVTDCLMDLVWVICLVCGSVFLVGEEWTGFGNWIRFSGVAIGYVCLSRFLTQALQNLEMVSRISIHYQILMKHPF